MTIKKIGILLTIMSISVMLKAEEVSLKPDVIYGQDERIEVSESTDTFIKDKARFVAAIIPQKHLTALDYGKRNYQIESLTLQEKKRMCPEERFVDQIAPANCSAFLVAPDVVVTAGHCILSDRDCEGYKFLFNFEENKIVERKGIKIVGGENVFSCKKVLSRKWFKQEKIDYAIVQLDRKVMDEKPLLAYKELEKDYSLDEYLVLGFPLGIPLKASDEAKFHQNSVHDPSRIFKIESDTFGGNSGSPVFSRSNGRIEGMIVAGETDLIWDDNFHCNRVKVCQEGMACTGEGVLKINEIPIEDSIKNRI